MNFRAITIGALVLSGCNSGGALKDGPIQASWRPRPGEVFTIKMQAIQEGEGGGSVIAAGELTIQEVGADGKSRGRYQLSRLELRNNGEATPSVLYENGALKAWKQGTPPEPGKLGSPLPVVLLPAGNLEAQSGTLPWNPLPFDALGVWLPGRMVALGEKWTGKVRAAYSDWVEVEYFLAEVQGRRVRIVGRSTAKAEEEHKILIRSEGWFLPEEGYVSDASLDIDFSPLKLDTRRKVSYEIRRH